MESLCFFWRISDGNRNILRASSLLSLKAYCITCSKWQFCLSKSLSRSCNREVLPLLPPQLFIGICRFASSFIHILLHNSHRNAFSCSCAHPAEAAQHHALRDRLETTAAHTNVFLLEQIQNWNITLNVASHLPEIFLSYFEIQNILVTICDLIICTACMAQRKQIVLMYQAFWAIQRG